MPSEVIPCVLSSAYDDCDINGVYTKYRHRNSRQLRMPANRCLFVRTTAGVTLKSPLMLIPDLTDSC